MNAHISWGNILIVDVSIQSVSECDIQIESQCEGKTGSDVLHSAE